MQQAENELMAEYKNPFSDRKHYHEHAEWIDDHLSKFFDDNISFSFSRNPDFGFTS